MIPLEEYFPLCDHLTLDFCHARSDKGKAEIEHGLRITHRSEVFCKCPVKVHSNKMKRICPA